MASFTRRSSSHSLRMKKKAREEQGVDRHQQQDDGVQQDIETGRIGMALFPDNGIGGVRRGIINGDFRALVIGIIPDESLFLPRILYGVLIGGVGAGFAPVFLRRDLQHRALRDLPVLVKIEFRRGKKIKHRQGENQHKSHDQKAYAVRHLLPGGGGLFLHFAHEYLYPGILIFCVFIIVCSKFAVESVVKY